MIVRLQRAYSSVGRAPVLHTGGHRFESFCAQTLYPNSYAGVVQLVRAPPCHGGSCGFEPRLPRFFLHKKPPIRYCQNYGYNSPPTENPETRFQLPRHGLWRSLRSHGNPNFPHSERTDRRRRNRYLPNPSAPFWKFLPFILPLGFEYPLHLPRL